MAATTEAVAKLTDASAAGEMPEDHKAAIRMSAKDFREDAEQATRRAAYHASLKRKYERAARYPWLPVEPDPPPPK